MDDLQPAAQRSSVLKLNHELERIADFYKQAAFSPDTGFAHIQNLARRREAPRCRRPARLTSTRDAFRLNPITLSPVLGIIRKRLHHSKGNCQLALQLSINERAHLLHASAIDA